MDFVLKRITVEAFFVETTWICGVEKSKISLKKESFVEVQQTALKKLSLSRK